MLEQGSFQGRILTNLSPKRQILQSLANPVLKQLLTFSKSLIICRNKEQALRVNCLAWKLNKVTLNEDSTQNRPTQNCFINTYEYQNISLRTYCVLISLICPYEFFVCLFLFQRKMKSLVLLSLPLETDQDTEVALNEDEKIGKCFSFYQFYQNLPQV